MKACVIDGSNLLHRTYWVAETRSKLINSKGVWTGPLYLFLKSIKSLQEKFSADEMWVVWDKKLNYPSINFRKQLLPEEYKQTRDNERTLKVHEQHDILNEWLECLGVKQMYPWVLEADDIISWLVKEKFSAENSVIVTVDKDLLQLVTSTTHYYNPRKKKLITKVNFEEEVGVPVEHYVKFKALLGDKSDNITGISGYGIQKSSKYCTESIESILSSLKDDEKQRFKTNLVLMDLHGSYNKETGETLSYEQQYTVLQELSPNIKRFEELCYEYELYSFVKDLDKWKELFIRQQNLVSLISRL
jgi:DNA polymerase-1